MKTSENIRNVLASILGDTYKVINNYDAGEEIDLNGTIAINFGTMENLRHGTENDYKCSVYINGLTLADEDKDKSLIQEMFDYTCDIITSADLTQEIDNLAGYELTNASIASDGEINTFSVLLDMFICDFQFN